MKKKQKKQYIHFLLLMLLIGIAGLTVFGRKVQAATEYKYLIKVNKQQNCITVYEKDEIGEYTLPVKAMVCSTGSATPLGTYNTKIKYRWKLLIEDVWGQYSTRITGSILFHSVWYYKQDPSTLSAAQYNKLGTTCSHGCIRLTVEDAKWIYDNCPLGTTVVIYNAKNPGPLGKPEAQKLPAGTGWDPTDPAEENPFHQAAPVILGAVNKTIEWGSKFNPKKGVTALSGKGNDLTDKIKVKGTVDTQKAGKYKLTYTVSDDYGNESKLSIKIKVKACPYKLEFQGIKDQVINESVEVTREYCLKDVTAYWGEEEIDENAIQVSVQKRDQVYDITYSVSSSSGETLEKTATYYVDTQPPVIEVEHVLYATKATVDREFVLDYVKVTDDYSEITADEIQVSIKKVYDRGHLVTFTVSDEAGNTASKTVQFTRTDLVVIEGVQNHTVPKGTVVDKEYVMQGITGRDVDQYVTDQIQVNISKPDHGVYTVSYELKNKYDDYMKIIAYFTEEG